jgi:hypothetical protein
MDVTELTFDFEAALAHRGQMRAARDECHVAARLDQSGAEVAADAARSHHSDFHSVPLIPAFRPGPQELSHRMILIRQIIRTGKKSAAPHASPRGP